MLGRITEGLGDACYVRSNLRGSWRHLLCQVNSQRVLERLVMLGPFTEALGGTCYVRSNPRGSWRHLLCQIQSMRVSDVLVMLDTFQEPLLCQLQWQRHLFCLVMLGPFQDTLLYQVQSLGTCFVRSICGDSCYVRLGPFLERIVMFGLGRNFVIFGSDLLCLAIFRLGYVRLGYFR